MPTLNEEQGIERCIGQIKRAVVKLGVTAEILISDSSSDNTPNLAREMGAIVVRPDDLGYGYAYRYAFERVRGKYIVIGDADTTYDFEELTDLFKCMMRTNADLVLGNRFGGDIKSGAMPLLHRYIGNPVLTKLLNGLYGTDVGDAHCGFRVIRRESLEELNLETDGMEFASEMIMKAGVNGLTIKEVPITYRRRKGDATLNSFRDGWRHAKFLVLDVL